MYMTYMTLCHGPEPGLISRRRRGDSFVTWSASTVTNFSLYFWSSFSVLLCVVTVLIVHKVVQFLTLVSQDFYYWRVASKLHRECLICANIDVYLTYVDVRGVNFCLFTFLRRVLDNSIFLQIFRFLLQELTKKMYILCKKLHLTQIIESKGFLQISRKLSFLAKKFPIESESVLCFL